jgi:O-antigen/teichoic acid export membrane protein
VVLRAGYPSQGRALHPGGGPRGVIARLFRKGGLRYVFAFADQGLNALLSLGVTLWLIRRGTAEQLGTYVFWANTVLVIGTFITAFTSVHIYRLPPTSGRYATERAILSANLTMAALAALLTLAVVPLLGHPLGLYAAAAFVPGIVIGLHARAVATARGDMGSAAAISAVPFIAVLAVVVAEAWLSAPPSVPLLLLVNGLSQGVAGIVIILRLCGPGAADFSASARSRWRVLARRSGWSLLAGMANETFTRLYIFMDFAWFGAPALATLTAAQTMLRPATLLAGAFGSAARGPLAARRHAGDTHGFLRLLVLGGTAPAIITLVLGGIIAALWPWVSAWLYAGRYAGLENVVLLWSVVMAISCFWVAGLAGLQSLARLRSLAIAEVGGAITCAVAMPPLLWLLAPPGALVAIIIGGCVQVALLGYGILKGLQALGHRRRSPA